MGVCLFPSWPSSTGRMTNSTSKAVAQSSVWTKSHLFLLNEFLRDCTSVAIIALEKKTTCDSDPKQPDVIPSNNTKDLNISCKYRPLYKVHLYISVCSSIQSHGSCSMHLGVSKRWGELQIQSEHHIGAKKGILSDPEHGEHMVLGAR